MTERNDIMAGFHVAEATSTVSLNIALADALSQYPELFRENVKIASFFGSMPLIWNGGRMILGRFYPDRAKAVIDAYNQRGIPYRFTFTNPFITEEYLDDPDCNTALEIADNGMNEAIVFSPMLEDYIRDKFPDMPITSSTCKQIEDFDELSAEMEKDYSLVVLDYNFNNNFDVLEKLPHKEKAELLINPCCTPACKRRGDHYRSIGRSQIACTQHMMKRTGTPYIPEPFECQCMKRTLYQTVDSPLHISPDAIYNKYVPMGYGNFKIEGRSVPDVNILENYIYYMVKPELRDKVRLDILLMLTKDFKYFK